MRHLYTYVAIGTHYPDGTCWAWMDSADRVCGRAAGAEPRLCSRHVGVAQRKRDAEQALEARDRARRAEREAATVASLPALRADLARVDAEMRRLDPPPPTTDPAAWGGKVAPTVRRYRARATSDAHVARMADLVRRREVLAREIAYAERLAAS